MEKKLKSRSSTGNVKNFPFINVLLVRIDDSIANCTAFFTTRIHSGVLDNPLILGEDVHAHWIVLEVACLNNEMRSKTVIL